MSLFLEVMLTLPGQTLVACPTTPVTGKVNGAQQFNGTTDKIEVPADPAFDFAATDNFSVEFWYKGVLSPLTGACFK